MVSDMGGVCTGGHGHGIEGEDASTGAEDCKR